MKLSLRSLLLGLGAVGVTVLIVSYAELVTGQIMIGFLQLPPVVVVLLFLLVLGNKAVRRLKPRWALFPAEQVVIYCMMLLAAMISSRGLMEDLIPTLVGVNYYANESNRWESVFFPRLQPWMVPWDVSGGPQQPVVRDFFEGLHYGEPIPWGAWLSPLICWSGLILLVYGTFLCLAGILQRQWADHEKLSFPLVQLPLEMVRADLPAMGGLGGTSFWRNRLMWLGFSLPVFLFGMNGLHVLFPAVPGLPVQVYLSQYFTTRPWNTLGYTTMFFSLAAVGFFYLLPSQVLLSFWFFYLFARLQLLVAVSFGLEYEAMPHGEGGSLIVYQTVGAYAALVGYWVWISRPHLRGVLQRALRRPGPDDRQELLPYAVAGWGLLLGFVAIVGWCMQMGMSPGFAGFVFLVYLFFQALVMARMTSEGGMPMTEGSFTPLDVYAAAAPRYTAGPANLTGLAFIDAFFSRDLRGLILTGFLDGQRMGDGVRLPRRKLLTVFGMAVLAAMVLAAAVHLYLPYRRGAITLYSYVYQGNALQFFRENEPLITREDPFRPLASVFTGIGVLVTALLAFLRIRFWWWPLHPLGYALCNSWTTDVFWFPLFVAWLIKALLVRYGGLPLYNRARPFFLGLIFGEFTMAVFWTLVAMIFNTPAPFFPWP